MRLQIPLTGTVLVEGSVWGEGKLTGDNADPIRPIDLDLGNVSWRMVDVDMANEVMIIEVEPAEFVNDPDLDTQGNQKIDADGKPMFKSRPATPREKEGFLQYARQLIEGHTKAELYALAGKPRLKRPA